MQGLPIVAARRRSRWQPTSPDWGSHPAAQRATSAPVQSAGSTLPEGLQPRRHTLEQERPSDDGRRHRHTSQMCTGSTTNMSSARWNAPHASPKPSRSLSVWSPFPSFGQLSQLSPRESPSNPKDTGKGVLVGEVA